MCSGVLDNVSDLTRGFIIAGIEFLALLFLLAATTFTLEALGEIPSSNRNSLTQYHDDMFSETGMGSVSMWQMSYWYVASQLL